MNQELAVPNPLEKVKALVLDSVSSPLTRVMYAHAMAEYFTWWEEQGRPAFIRATAAIQQRNAGGTILT